MNYTIHTIQGKSVAELTASDTTILDGQTFLDITMNLPTDLVLIHKAVLGNIFFDLRSGVAGDILQKAANYRIRLAIVGDYSTYNSKSLHDFIYESNKGNLIAFVSTIDEGLAQLVR